MKLSAIAKLAKAKATGAVADQMAELMSLAGLEVDMQLLANGQQAVAFQHAALASMQPGAQVIVLRVVAKDGTNCEALIVIPPEQSIVDGDGKVVVKTGSQVYLPPGKAATAVVGSDRTHPLSRD